MVPVEESSLGDSSKENFFSQNLSSLISRYPHLSGIEVLLDDENSRPFIEKWNSFSSKTGDPTAEFGGIALHSKYNPRRESDQIIAKEFPAGTQCAIFAGWGLGYYIESFLKEFPDSYAIVTEPDPILFLLSLQCRDFSKILESERLILIIGETPDSVTRAMADFQGKVFHVLSLRPLYKSFSEYYSGVEEIVQKAIFRQQINLNTLKIFGKRWVKNFCANLPLLPESLGIETLKESFEGFPALIVAAGPSLREVLPFIKELSERMIIICVDTAIPILLKEGVEPDIGVVVDPQYWNSRHLDNVSTEKTVLVTESSVYPSVFRHFKLPYFFYESAFPLIHHVETVLGIKGDLYKGGSVATAAWEIGRYLGCSSVYCAGADLGFPGGETHFKGGFFEESRHAATSRMKTAEEAGWKYLHDAGIFPVENMSGGKTLTDKRMSVYITWFNEQTERYPNYKTYSFSRYGSKIENTELTTPEKTLSLPVKREEIDALWEKSISGNVKIESLQKQKQELLIETTETLIAGFAEVRQLSAQGLSLVSRLKREISTGQNTKETLKEMDKTDSLLMNAGGKEFIAFIFQAILRDIGSESNKNPSEEQIIENSRNLYQQLFDSAEFHIERFTRIEW